MSIARPYFWLAWPIWWTICSLSVIAGVWTRVFPWWMVAILVTLNCIVFICDKWIEGMSSA